MPHRRLVIAPIGRDPEDRRTLVHRARKRGFSRFAVRPEDSFDPPPGEETLFWDGTKLRRTPVADAALVAEASDVSSPEELESLLARTAPGSVALVRWSGDRIIPLENAVARKGRTAQVWVVTDRPADVPAALGALEHGADTVVVELDRAELLDVLEAYLERVIGPPGSWELVAVHGLKPAGLGDRVIVDTTSLLLPTEGLLVGSAAAFLFHVASEAEGSAFTRPRPFRVNAGAAHSYTLLADGTTRYLSELRPGDSVLVVDPSGSFRSVRVGRIKTERRPMVLVEARRGTRTYTVFLQDAETVRLSGESSRVATTELEPGTRVYGMSLPAARHLGTAIEETIDEL